MPLKLTCPKCGSDVRLHEPLPMPGDEVHCTACAVGLAVTYPPGIMEQLQDRGKQFADRPSGAPNVPREQRLTPAQAQGRHEHLPLRPGGGNATPMGTSRRPTPPPAPSRVTPSPKVPPPDRAEAGTAASTELPPTAVDPTQIAEDDDYFEIDRTVPSGRSPYGGLPGNAPEPEGLRGLSVPELSDPGGLPAGWPLPVPPGSSMNKKSERTSPAGTRKKRRGVAGLLGCFGSMGMMGAGGVALVGITGLVAAGAGYGYYSKDLPTVEALRAYRPPTVTVVTDHKGEILGEIFDQRRYVVPIEDIPEHVRNAFLASEDANFWDHGGVDYMGMVRAMGRNLKAGRLAQGASTITQQVARNFLLTRDKKIERKIKEILLSWRIENTYTKEHILYLYLNEIFLGSHAYGVEAASRAYFGKSVKEISVAEAAILAGLPQRPSDYSPHRHWSAARARQEYVIDQMVQKGHLTDEQGAAALAEEVRIVPRDNTFLEKAPHFTEHVRRHLVEQYGEEQVLNQGLQVRTTCDLDLQTLAQESVTKGVFDVDQRMGFRRAAITHIAPDAIEAKRKEHEDAMRKAWALAQDAAGRVEPPAKSVLEAGEVYTGVLLEVHPKWARVGIGAHEGIIPIAWSDWVYEPNPRKSWRYRTATDLTAHVDTDDKRGPDEPVLQKGDVVLVKVVDLSTKSEAVAKAFKKTPGASEDTLAIRLWQDPEVESALLSMDLETGAVRAMVGGANFRKSQFNRAIQSRRQVGSTFKPIVYASAIQSRKVTTSTIVPDAPLAFATDQEFIWKPSNYGHEYAGNLTLRQALAGSKNTCTVRVLESIDPGMNDDVVYSFARALGIGGPPTAELPADWVPSPQNDVLCPWTREHKESTICMDHYPPRTDNDVTNTRHRAALGPDDEHWCRTCDMSMGLGSASLTMEELLRAYSPFSNGGKLVKPYYIEEVRDRDGNVLEKHETAPWPQVMEPEVASITAWLLEGVVEGGTGFPAHKALGLDGLGGKTGTTNDEKDAWFVGFTNNVITTVWVGFDQPRSLGVSSTGGRTALPIWIDYMREAAPKERDGPFQMRGNIEWANIDSKTGRRVTSGGRSYPYLDGTAPERTGFAAGQVSLDDLTTDL